MEILIKVLRNSSIHIIFKMKDVSYMGLNIPGVFALWFDEENWGRFIIL